jgi:hypothetical protein
MEMIKPLIGVKGIEPSDPSRIQQPGLSPEDWVTTLAPTELGTAPIDPSSTGPDVVNGGSLDEAPIDRTEQAALIGGSARPIPTTGFGAADGYTRTDAVSTSTTGQDGDTASAPISFAPGNSAAFTYTSINGDLSSGETNGTGASLGSASATGDAIGPDGATRAQVQQALDESGSLTVTGGTGVMVGVISDSFNNLGGAAADEADGALPPSVLVLGDDPSGGSDEGRAMLQIVHDVAPGANLAFDTTGNSDQAMANAILALAAAGCKVICDDVTFFDEPFFQTGPIANAIQTVEQEGVTYLTDAGNQAAAAFQSAWTPIGSTSFDGVALTDTLNFGSNSPVQTVTIGPDTSPSPTPLILQWNQPYGAATADLAMAVFSGSTFLGTFTNRGSGNPDVQINLPPGTYQIAIENLNGTATDPSLVKDLIYNDSAPDNVSMSGANAGTVIGHHMEPDAITVGAVDAADTPAFGVNPPESEPFSSSGAGTELWFNFNGTAVPGAPEDLNPVAVSGVDDINTTVSDLADFFGTSAATPAVAGVVALMLQANPNLTPNQVQQILEASAVPVSPPPPPSPSSPPPPTPSPSPSPPPPPPPPPTPPLLSPTVPPLLTPTVPPLLSPVTPPLLSPVTPPLLSPVTPPLLSPVTPPLLSFSPPPSSSALQASATASTDPVSGAGLVQADVAVADALTPPPPSPPSVSTLQSGPQTVIGAAGDTITGGSGPDLINAIAGRESIAGGSGSTTVWGGAGDTITGSTGSGTAIIIGAAGTTISGGSGSDLINGLAGPESIGGGSGSTTVWGGTGDTITGSTGSGTAIIIGAAGTTITGGSGSDLINGLAGPESIAGGSGSTTIWGGAGDTITGSTGSGSSIIIGAPGTTITGGSGADLINGTLGSQAIAGGSGAATVWGGAADTITGGTGQLTVDIDHANFPGAELVGDNGTTGSDTVTGFSQSAGDRIFFPNETTTSINNVVATAQSSNGNTLITLPDGATITLIAVTKIDATFFA